MYLIPSRVVAGRVQILLRTYSNYIVGNASGLVVSRQARHNISHHISHRKARGAAAAYPVHAG